MNQVVLVEPDTVRASKRLRCRVLLGAALIVFVMAAIVHAMSLTGATIQIPLWLILASGLLLMIASFQVLWTQLLNLGLPSFPEQNWIPFSFVWTRASVSANAFFLVVFAYNACAELWMLSSHHDGSLLREAPFSRWIATWAAIAVFVFAGRARELSITDD